MPDASTFASLGQNDNRDDMIYTSPTWNSARSAYKAYTFKKDDAKLLDGTTEVVYDEQIRILDGLGRRRHDALRRFFRQFGHA